MTKIGLFVDEASDIMQFPDLFESLDVEMIHQYVNIGDETYTYKNLTIDELLVKMENADKENWPHTSTPSVGDFMAEYEKLKEKGYTDAIAILVGAKVSGTVNSARLAIDEVEGINIHIVDSQMASIGVLPSIMKARELIDAGLEPEEIQRKVQEFTNRLELFGAVPKLDNLYKGGRLKPIKYWLGRFFSFKPILRMYDGELKSHDKTRHLEATQEKAYDYAVEPYSQDDDFELFIAHAWAEESAKRFVKKFEEDFPGKKCYMGRIGPTIGVHLGPEGLVFTAYPKD